MKILFNYALFFQLYHKALKGFLCLPLIRKINYIFYFITKKSFYLTSYSDSLYLFLKVHQQGDLKQKPVFNLHPIDHMIQYLNVEDMLWSCIRCCSPDLQSTTHCAWIIPSCPVLDLMRKNIWFSSGGKQGGKGHCEKNYAL